MRTIIMTCAFALSLLCANHAAGGKITNIIVPDRCEPKTGDYECGRWIFINTSHALGGVLVFAPYGVEKVAHPGVALYLHGIKDNPGNIEKQYKITSTVLSTKFPGYFMFVVGLTDAPNSGWGGLQKTNGLAKLLEDVAAALAASPRPLISQPKFERVALLAHSAGGYGAGVALAKGGVAELITHLGLFDAFYKKQLQAIEEGRTEFQRWVQEFNHGKVLGIYTNQYRRFYTPFIASLANLPASRRQIEPANHCRHNAIVRQALPSWLQIIGDDWRATDSPEPSDPESVAIARNN